ncbi:MAG: hypothetical protein GF383_01945 [Candidatus Lokiarchaeota archaeon]|nr:hypothetical protein [Candidatus Lokiarchaeota archaeon]
MKNNKVSRRGLIKNWYDIELEAEKFNLARIEKIAIDRVSPEFLLTLEEDVLYQFLPSYDF